MHSDTAFRQQMFALVGSWEGSGKTQREFCSEQDISFHRFTYWLRRYREHQKEASGAAPSFIPLSLDAAIGSSAEIIYPDGRRLIFHQAVAAQFLKALLG